jgi:mono/diheme cytochrome c family protein
MVAMLIALVLAALAPLVWLLVTRGKPFSSPRVDWIQDMGVQPRFGPQAASSVFADGRAMRLPVAGTIAQGSLQHETRFHLGYESRPGPDTGKPVMEFVAEFPEQIASLDQAKLLVRGSARYGIYCAPCHGPTGSGDGPVALRAKELAEPKWVPPTHLMMQSIRDKPNGYLFSVMTRGVRNMPSYAIQISAEDRWAIVAYLRQLHSQQPVAPEVQPIQPAGSVPNAAVTVPTPTPQAANPKNLP